MEEFIESASTNAVATTTTAKKKTRTVRAGYKHIYVEVTDAQYDALNTAALNDDRKGGAPEMLSVLLKRNLNALLATTSTPTVSE